MEDPLDLHPMSSRRQGALFQRNPVCALCYRICMDMCDEQGGINFQLIHCLEEADRLCEKIVLNPWELEGIEEYYHKMERRLDSCQISLSCAFATVCVTLNCMTNLPEPVYQLAHDLRGLIIGEGNGLYNMLQQSAYRADISMPGAMYGDIPPLPKPQRELQELQRKCAEATTEIQTLKNQLKMEQEQAKQRPERIIHVAGNYIAEMTINNDIHDNHNCRIYATAQPEEKEEAEGEEEREEEDCGNSFFAARFPEDVVRKNIREAIDFASSKADACRRIMALETQGYIILSNVGDDRKAELINPYAQPKITLTGEDFKKARNRR